MYVVMFHSASTPHRGRQLLLSFLYSETYLISCHWGSHHFTQDDCGPGAQEGTHTASPRLSTPHPLPAMSQAAGEPSRVLPPQRAPSCRCCHHRRSRQCQAGCCSC